MKIYNIKSIIIISITLTYFFNKYYLIYRCVVTEHLASVLTIQPHNLLFNKYKVTIDIVRNLTFCTNNYLVATW